MIGSGLKKLAAEHNMRVSNGVGYGDLRGYAATLSEGAGWKQVAFSVSFPDPARKSLFMDVVSTADVEKQYRVLRLGISGQNIVVIFHDNPGTMKRIRQFLDWFIPLLDEYGATKSDICPECGMQVTDSAWKLIDGVAYNMHNACAEKVRGEIADDNESRKQEATGSYGSGLVGALIGAAIGAILWAVVLNMGYVASIVGLVIGFLAEKGYNLLRGKQGKGKIIILIVSIIFGVVIGTFAADAITVAGMISEGEANMTYGDIPRFLITLLQADAEYFSAVVSNILMGLLFAGLGVFALLRKASKAVADTKFIDLQ
jgi:hypothetical protein